MQAGLLICVVEHRREVCIQTDKHTQCAFMHKLQMVLLDLQAKCAYAQAVLPP